MGIEKNKKSNKILILIITIGVILDQIAKIIAYNQGWNIITNETLDSSNNGYYIVMSIIIIIMIIRYITNDNTFIKLDTKIILSFAVSGAIGNLIDRIWNKDVIIFISLGNNFNVNLAYLYIGIAWVGLAVILTKNSMKFLREMKNKKGDRK